MAGALVLCYHRIVPRIPEDRFGIANRWNTYVTLSRFQGHVAVLRRRFALVSLEELHAQALAGDVRPNQVAVTFDDGYADLYQFAWPVLRQQGVPFTVFPVTENVERQTPFWWDRLTQLILRAAGGVLAVPGRQLDLREGADQRARVREAHWWLQKWLWSQEGAQRDAWLDAVDAPASDPEDRPLTWAELREMVDGGATVGAHTHTHPALSEISYEVAVRELRTCMDMLGARLGRRPRFMAYPFGMFDDTVQALAAEVGLQVSLTVWPGWCQADNPRHAWPRVVVPDCDPGAFAAVVDVLARCDPATLDVDTLWHRPRRSLPLPVRRWRRRLGIGIRTIGRAVRWASSLRSWN